MEKCQNNQWEQTKTLLDALLKQHNLPLSSLHGAENSSKEPCLKSTSQFISSSSREFNRHTSEYSREFRRSCTRMINLLQEEIDASEALPEAISSSAALPATPSVFDDSVGDPVSAEFPPSMEAVPEDILAAVEFHFPIEAVKRPGVLKDEILDLNEFFNSTEQIQVPTVLMVATNPTSDFNGGVADFLKAIMAKSIDPAEALGPNKLDVDSNFSFNDSIKLTTVSEIYLSRTHLMRTSVLHPDANYSVSGTAVVSLLLTRSSLGLVRPPPLPPEPPDGEALSIPSHHHDLSRRYYYLESLDLSKMLGKIVVDDRGNARIAHSSSISLSQISINSSLQQILANPSNDYIQRYPNILVIAPNAENWITFFEFTYKDFHLLDKIDSANAEFKSTTTQPNIYMNQQSASSLLEFHYVPIFPSNPIVWSLFVISNSKIPMCQPYFHASVGRHLVDVYLLVMDNIIVSSQLKSIVSGYAVHQAMISYIQVQRNADFGVMTAYHLKFGNSQIEYDLRIICSSNIAIEHVLASMPHFDLEDKIIFRGVDNVERDWKLYATKVKFYYGTLLFLTLIEMYANSRTHERCWSTQKDLKVLEAKINMATNIILLHSIARTKRGWRAKALYMDMINNRDFPNDSKVACDMELLPFKTSMVVLIAIAILISGQSCMHTNGGVDLKILKAVLDRICGPGKTTFSEKLIKVFYPYVHKVFVGIGLILIDDYYYAYLEWRRVISNRSKTAG